MAVEFHSKWLCRGLCELSKFDYDDQILRVVKKLAQKEGRGYGPSSSLPYKKAILTRYSSPVGNRVFVVDKELHGNFWVLPLDECSPPETQEAIYAKMMALAADEMALEANKAAGFKPLIEIYLWCAVNLCDLDALVKTISAHRDSIPPCILGSLLSQAIFLAFEEGADALLEFGASAEYNNSRGPLNDVFLAFMRSMNAEGNSSEAMMCKFQKLTSIMKKLIDHGASLLFGDRRVICNQRLHWVPNLAVADANAVRVLLEAMPQMAFRIPRALVLPGVDYDQDEGGDSGDFGGPLSSQCSALASTIYRAAQAYSDTRSPPTNWVKVLVFGTVPLIRAGAICDPDPLERRRVNLALGRLIQDKDGIIAHFWGRPTAVLDIVIAARGKASLDVDLLRQCLTHQVPNLPMTLAEQTQWVKNFTEVFRQQFPRPLQALCRDVITHRLPVGARQRPDAIKKLDLPIVLGDYLNFRDLDVLPGTLDVSKTIFSETITPGT